MKVKKENVWFFSGISIEKLIFFINFFLWVISERIIEDKRVAEERSKGEQWDEENAGGEKWNARKASCWSSWTFIVAERR